MTDSKVSAPQPVALDLSGFYRRLPRAAIAWHVGRLSADDTLPIILDPATDTDSVLEALRCCGAEIISDEVSGEVRVLSIRKSNVVSITRELDMRGRRCPIPVIEARRQLRGMASGEVLKMFTDCTSAPADVNAWTANSEGVTFLGTWQQGANHVFLLGSR